jgi:hypothetical protein
MREAEEAARKAEAKEARKQQEMNRAKQERAANERKVKEREDEKKDYARQKAAIERDTGWLSRIIVYNHCEVTVHLRVFTDFRHLVWDYANNVRPGQFAQLICPTPGLYNVDVCLATGPASTFSTREQIANNALDPTIVGLVSRLTQALGESHALITLEAGSDINTAARSLFTEMQKACEGQRALRLLKEWPFWVGKTKRLILSGGPSLRLGENGSGSAPRTKIIYKFDRWTKPLKLEAVDDFESDKPAGLSANQVRQEMFD